MLYPTWSWAWPVNRRIIYNRCSLDPQGIPWSPKKAMFHWDPAAKTWKNLDIPDFGWINPQTKEHIPPEVSAKVEFVPAADKIDVKLAGKLITSYRFDDSLTKPVLYPIQTPGDVVLTRGFPIKPLPGETNDHPHHIGLFFTYDKVNGIGFWE
jgi:hypothetical protein